MTAFSASKWKQPSSPFQSVTLLKSDATSVGDCMRDLDNRDLITGDFLLVSGDVVANIDLTSALATHKARREKDKNAIMTMILRESGLNSQRRSRERKPVFVIDPKADRCLHYEEIGGGKAKGSRLLLDPDIFSSHSEIDIREDLIDCGIDICTPDVLLQWQENFDYQSLRKSFLFGVLKDYELNGKTIHTYIASDQYATRVKDLPAYTAISKDVAGGWTIPYHPSSNFLRGQKYVLSKGKNFLEPKASISRSAVTKGRNVLGDETIIGDGSLVQDSSFGRRCKVGKHVTIRDSIIWDDVTIEDHTVVQNSIIATGSTIGSKCQIRPGSLINFTSNIPDATTTTAPLPPKSREPPRSESPTSKSLDSTDSDSDGSNLSGSFYHNLNATLSISSISTLESDTAYIDDDEATAGPFPSSDLIRQRLLLDPDNDDDENAQELAEAAQKALSFHAEATSSILDGLQKEDAAETIFLELNSYRMSENASPQAVRAAIVSAFMLRVAQLMRGGRDVEFDDSAGAASEEAQAKNTSSMTPKQAVSKVFGPYNVLIERVLLDRGDQTPLPSITGPGGTAAAGSEAGRKTDQIDFMLQIQKKCAFWPPKVPSPYPPDLSSSPSTSSPPPTSDATKAADGQKVLLFSANELYDLDLLEYEAVFQWWEDERAVLGHEMQKVRGLVQGFVDALREAESESEDEEDEDEDDEEEAEAEESEEE